MDTLPLYERRASQSPAELLAIAQGLLLTEHRSDLILVSQLTGYRAQRVLEDQAGQPGNRFGLSVEEAHGEIVVCFGGWEEHGIFLARRASTEVEKLVVGFDWNFMTKPREEA